MSIYCCGDIHGQKDIFDKMLNKINFSPEDTLYIIGDIIDRGDKSIELIQYIMKQPNIFCLLGNHELMMYNHYKMITMDDYWLLPNNGGMKTLEQFEKLSKNEQEEILNFIHNMLLQKELIINDQKFLLSHSFFEIEESDIYWKDANYYKVFHIVWYSPWRQHEFAPIFWYCEDTQRIHIIGHVPTQRIIFDMNQIPSAYIEENVINIDTGCAFIQDNPNYKDKFALCCLNLSQYSLNKDPNSFIYIKGDEL